MTTVLTDGSRDSDIWIGSDFVDAAAYAKRGKRLASHGRIRVGADGPMQSWYSTLGISDSERVLRRSAGTSRVTYFESQAIERSWS